MSGVALALALASALLHAGWNALLKRSRDLEATSTALFAVAILGAAATVPLQPGPAFPGRAAWGWALGAGLCEGGYFIALVACFARGGLGWAYAWMRGAALLFAWPLGILALGERVGAVAATGVLVVLAGLVLLGARDAGVRTGTGAPVIGWALAAGAAIAGFNGCYKAALAAGAQPAALFALSMLVGLPLQLAARIGRGQPVLAWPRRPGLAVAAGLLCTASFLCYLAALRGSGSAAVLTLRNVSVLFAALLGLADGERPAPRQWAGGVLVGLGAALLAWPAGGRP